MKDSISTFSIDIMITARFSAIRTPSKSKIIGYTVDYEDRKVLGRLRLLQLAGRCSNCSCSTKTNVARDRSEGVATIFLPYVIKMPLKIVWEQLERRKADTGKLSPG